jgi:uncharacterized protein YfkK (UPF0435 family)
MPKSAADPPTPIDPQATLRRRILAHLSDPHVPADTEQGMALALGVKREKIHACLVSMLAAVEVTDVMIESLAIYRMVKRGEVIPVLEGADREKAVAVLAAFKRSAAALTMETAWRLAGYGEFNATGSGIMIKLEKLNMIYSSIQSTFRISPSGRKFLEANK